MRYPSGHPGVRPLGSPRSGRDAGTRPANRRELGYLEGSPGRDRRSILAFAAVRHADGSEIVIRAPLPPFHGSPAVVARCSAVPCPCFSTLRPITSLRSTATGSSCSFTTQAGPRRMAPRETLRDLPKQRMVICGWDRVADSSASTVFDFSIMSQREARDYRPKTSRPCQQLPTAACGLASTAARPS